MPESQLLQGAVLQIAHIGVQLRHRVADRRARSKRDALPSGQLREILSSVFVNFSYKFSYYSQPIFWHVKKKRVDSDCLPAFLVD